LKTRRSIALLAATLLAHGYAVRAAPLDKDDCAKLKTEQGLLEQNGARGDMSRGPEWAKGNLASDKLEQIRRLIEVDEQLLFRCQGRPLVNLREALPQPREAVGKEAAKTPAKTPVAKAVKAPKGEKKSQPAKKTAATPPVADKGAAKTAPAAKASAAPGPAPAKEPKAEDTGKAAKPKTKRKANDAYSPPAADWSSNPFADLQAPAAKK
jgi:hypothetical protein